MSNSISSVSHDRRTTRAIDITGRDNLMLLLPNPGDEIAYGAFIAELCARGRPPFVVILADGAEDGTHSLANRRERESRAALSILGVPDDRVLFVGLRMGSIPTGPSPFFKPLFAAMALLNWRKDCNVIGATKPKVNDTDRLATWQVAAAVAQASEIPFLVGTEIGDGEDAPVDGAWIFDGTAWHSIAAQAAAVQDNSSNHIDGLNGISRFELLQSTSIASPPINEV